MHIEPSIEAHFSYCPLQQHVPVQAARATLYYGFAPGVLESAGQRKGCSGVLLVQVSFFAHTLEALVPSPACACLDWVWLAEGPCIFRRRQGGYSSLDPAPLPSEAARRALVVLTTSLSQTTHKGH